MKFSTTLSLCLAPVALAKSIRNSYPQRRSSHNSGHDSSKGMEAAKSAGLTLGSIGEIIVIWVNGGGGASTTTVNSVQTVTQTVTAGAAAAATAATGTTAAAGTGTATGSGAGATHTVIVGGAKGLIYEPDSIQAAVGDMVIFTFLSQNHTVSQSAFATPCKLLDGGMDSGFQPNVNNTVNPPPQVALQVMVATPLWFYCRQAHHCGKGMVFSINPTASKTQAMFQSMAIAQNGTDGGSAITGGTASAAAPAAAGTTASSAAAAAGTAAAAAPAAPPAGTSAAPAAAAPAAASSAAAAAPAAPAAASSAPAAAAPAAPAASTDPSTGVTTGTGTVNSDGSCSCAVLCSSNAFPAVQAQGIGAFGGFGGSVPMAALPAAM